MEEIGWSRQEFDIEKQFVVTVIDHALRRHGWVRLPFSVPEGSHVFEALERLRELVVEFPPDAVGQVRADAWVPDELPDSGVCQAHRVYLHETGCIICNDAPIDAPAGAAPNRSLGQ